MRREESGVKGKVEGEVVLVEEVEGVVETAVRRRGLGGVVKVEVYVLMKEGVVRVEAEAVGVVKGE